MQYFNKDFVKFLKDLGANNNRDWFHANKARFEESVKNPFQKFVQDMAIEVGKKEKGMETDPKKLIFRIYRDVRFSKDKTPYKTNMSAIIAPGGRKEMEKPSGFYMELSPEHVRVYCGAYMLSKERLLKLRKTLAKDPKAIDKLRKQKTFENYFGDIRGDKNKRLDKSFQAASEKQALIFNKQFYFFHEMKSGLIASKDLKKSVLAAYKAGLPMAAYLRKGMGYKS